MAKSFLLLLVPILVLASVLATTNGYKILGVLHTAARSHYIVGSSLLKALARKGHEVTVLSPFPPKKPIENFSNIDLPKARTLMEAEIKNLFKQHERSILAQLISFHDMGAQVTDATLAEPEVQKLMRSNQTFDVVIAEVFLSEALLGLAQHFNAPLIGLGTFGAISWNTDLIGSPSPPSYVPHAMLPLTDHMNFLQRLGNFAFLNFERALLDLWYLPKQEEIYKRNFPDAKQTMDEVRKNTALILLNQHISLSYSRPYVQNQIEVGGMHINRKRSPLPADIAKFIEDSKHGVIYFSMGSNLKSTDLPLEKRKALLETFRGLKQRVLWKFEDPNLEGKPDNVFISDWFPQDDILAHPNLKLFITHGGLLSTTESIYHGKPFIGIPIFGDQFLNMQKAVANGYGIMVEYERLNEPSLTDAIMRMLSNPQYMELVKSMSARFRDQPMEPMDTALYWVEHIIRHKGAKYMHNAGQDLNMIEYHNLDVILALYGGIVIVFLIILWTVKVILKRMLGLGQKKQVKKQKRN